MWPLRLAWAAAAVAVAVAGSTCPRHAGVLSVSTSGGDSVAVLAARSELGPVEQLVGSVHRLWPSARVTVLACGGAWETEALAELRLLANTTVLPAPGGCDDDGGGAAAASAAVALRAGLVFTSRPARPSCAAVAAATAPHDADGRGQAYIEDMCSLHRAMPEFRVRPAAAAADGRPLVCAVTTFYGGSGDPVPNATAGFREAHFYNKFLRSLAAMTDDAGVRGRFRLGLFVATQFRDRVWTPAAAEGHLAEIRAALGDGFSIVREVRVAVGVHRLLDVTYKWNAAMVAAYGAGCDYFLQGSDDITFESGPSTLATLVDALRRTRNLGMTGLSDLSPEKLYMFENLVTRTGKMTLAFAHRTHLEVMGGAFWPPVLKNWWMDDYAELVYGALHTQRPANATCKNTLGDVHRRSEQKQEGRYAWCNQHRELLRPLVRRGRRAILRWMRGREGEEREDWALEREYFELLDSRQLLTARMHDGNVYYDTRFERYV